MESLPSLSVIMLEAHFSWPFVLNLFLGDEFLPLGDPKKTSATYTKDFCENIGPNSPNLKEIFSEIFRQSHRVFFSNLWRRWVGKHAQEDSAKFGYRWEVEEENGRIGPIIWRLVAT
jgi:hypothetical protein